MASSKSSKAKDAKSRKSTKKNKKEGKGVAKQAAKKAAKKTAKKGSGAKLTRAVLIDALNEDLAREYQAIIAYVTYSQKITGPQYMHIAGELEVHAAEELAHAITIAKQVDYLGGDPTVKPKTVKTSDNVKSMLRADLEAETETIRNYRRRILQCEELGEFSLGEEIRTIVRQEQDHLIELAEALGIDAPDPGIA